MLRFAAALASLVTACDATSPPDAGPPCTSLDASSCPDALPSYTTDIVPLIDRACNSTCHAPGQGPWPLTGYYNVSAWWLPLVSVIETCTMPPPDASAGNGSLSDPERAMLLEWLRCGHPNN